MGGNHLTSLPDNMYLFKNIRILFFANNNFEEIPLCLGEMTSLFMLSFKSNRIHTIHMNSLSSSIGWLILTDNQITNIPSSIGKLTGLRKLMLANNCISNIPEEIQQCQELQLIRLSCNKLSIVPSFIYNLPKLSWIAFSSNIFNQNIEMNSQPINYISKSDIVIGDLIGEGASGRIYSAQLTTNSAISLQLKSSIDNERYALKLFKGSCTSDGIPADEVDISLRAGSHCSILSPLAAVVDDAIETSADSDSINTSLRNAPMGLLFPILSSLAIPLASPPSFDSVTQDIYRIDAKYDVSFMCNLLSGIASACAHLHGRGIMHGGN
jgi:hypothetical protein